MDVLRVAFMVVAVAMALALLAFLRMEWNDLKREASQERGMIEWHRMWHERIWETTDERDGREGPP